MNTVIKKLGIIAVVMLNMTFGSLAYANSDGYNSGYGNSFSGNTAAHTANSFQYRKFYIRLFVVNSVNLDTKTLSVTAKNNKVYTVDASNTKIVRRNGGASALSEISIGDRIRVLGSFDPNDSTRIIAKKIRDFSLMRIYSGVSGFIETIGSSSLTLGMFGQATYTVNVSSTTKFVGKDNVAVNGFGDLKVGDQVLAKGLKDTATKTVQATQVKLLNRPGLTPPPRVEVSGINGKAMIGPTCPVEHFPQLPECVNKNYVGKLEISLKAAMPVLVKRLLTDENGRFNVQLDPGVYVITLPAGNVFPTLMPKEVTVKSGEYTFVMLMIDSGIR